MELEGTIKEIFDAQTFDSGFVKREMILTTEEQYPQDIKVEFLKDRTSALDKVNKGDRVKVGINIRGNEFKGRYYVNIVGWKIDEAGASDGAGAMPPSAPMPAANDAPTTDEIDDDLPF